MDPHTELPMRSHPNSRLPISETAINGLETDLDSLEYAPASSDTLRDRSDSAHSTVGAMSDMKPQTDEHTFAVPLIASSSDETTSGAQQDMEQDTRDAIFRNLGPEYLRTEIYNRLEENPIGLQPEGHYVPDESLHDLLRIDAIRAALKDDQENVDLENYIRNVAPKTFATLQLVFDQPETRKHAMQQLKLKAFTDENLNADNLSMCGSCPCTKENCAHYFPHSDPWNSVSLKRFQEQRCQFLIPELGHEVFRYTFDSKRLLPFKATGELEACGAGYFSDVKCVYMLVAKQTVLSYTVEVFIRVAHKTLKPMSQLRDYNVRQEWYRETEAHKQLNGRSEHLVQGIAAYHQKAVSKGNDTYHIVLEWADGGNLQSFLEDCKGPLLDNDLQRSRERLKEVLEQLLGLAGAVECMHTESPTSSRSSAQNSNRASPDMLTAAHIAAPAIPLFNLSAAQDNQQLQSVPSSMLPDSSTPANNPVIKEPESEPAPKFLARRNSVDHKNWRHGDIKPENILRFTGKNKGSWLGILKLADLGRAQQHDKKTEFRKSKEKEDFRTIFYEPPDLSEDLSQQAHGKISRLFDIWSMGCVIFETVLCMVYGYEAVEAFQKIERRPGLTPYWEKTGDFKYVVTAGVTQWMDHILKYRAGRRPSAIGDLIILVKERLLQIKLPFDSDVYESGKRTNAKDMKRVLASILATASRDPVYLFDGIENFPPPLFIGEDSLSRLEPSATYKGSSRGFNQGHSNTPKFLSPSTAQVLPTSKRAGNSTRLSQDRDYTDPMIETWQYPDDHQFAQDMLEKHPIPDEYEEELCEYCAEVDMMASELTFETSRLQESFEDCPLCTLVYKVIAGTELQGLERFTLTRDDDHFVFRGATKTTKLFRVCCSTYHLRLDHTKVSIGARHLFTPSCDPKSGTLFWELPKAWLLQCDNSHKKSCELANQIPRLPKRLIDVWRPKLVESAELDGRQDQVRYLAFSHKWGREGFAVTTASNIQARKKRIPPKELPKSFADAIAVTKALGCDYLWIDSLCINQRCEDDDGDFDEQADDMQTIYSNAYCVIAASSANGATKGFLDRSSELNELPAVKVGSVFVSAITNDFTRDVLESPLHRRGWVLQEHALARRTIFFTANQMYWECGDGVRCETLRKLKHDGISLLGDAHFPSKVIEVDGTRGKQIRLWSSLFKGYALLELSRPPDRSVAIEGLMARLASAFKTDSLFGLFGTFWGRCLLWRRPQDGVPMERVPQGGFAIKLAPTWSWMAVLGGIDFLSPPGGKVDWNTSDVDLPPALRRRMTQDQRKTLPQRPADSLAEGDEIKAKAFSFAITSRLHGEQGLYFDDDTERAEGHVKAVIICSSQEEDPNMKVHHVLLIVEAAPSTEPPTYERIGVGLLPEACIDRSSGVRIAIG
ncbi:unnamed protein product [Alternaria alternata]